MFIFVANEVFSLLVICFLVNVGVRQCMQLQPTASTKLSFSFNVYKRLYSCDVLNVFKF